MCHGGFEAAYARRGFGISHLAPFPLPPGGLFIGFGEIFNAGDLILDSGNPLCAKLAKQFVYGAQMGWFSLGGVTHGPDVDTVCGKMGTYDDWMDPSADNVVGFLGLLVNLRAASMEFLQHGRALAAPPLNPLPYTFTTPPPNRNTGEEREEGSGVGGEEEGGRWERCGGKELHKSTSVLGQRAPHTRKHTRTQRTHSLTHTHHIYKQDRFCRRSFPCGQRQRTTGSVRVCELPNAGWRGSVHSGNHIGPPPAQRCSRRAL